MRSNPNPLWFLKLNIMEWYYKQHFVQLSDRQTGWYFRLLMECWLNAGILPSDPVELARIAHAGKKAFAKDGDAVLAFFPEDGTGRRTCPELQKQHGEAMAAIEKKKNR